MIRNLTRSDINYRVPRVEDGAAMWSLVRDSGTLDINSPYCYLLLCKHFSDTSLVADMDGEVVGFVNAYLIPERNDTVFVWQIGVRTDWQGRGVAGHILREMLRRDVCREVQFLEATVTPSNEASRALFKALARRLDSGFFESRCFDTALFPDGSHEPENLIRIGPFHAGDNRTV